MNNSNRVYNLSLSEHEFETIKLMQTIAFKFCNNEDSQRLYEMGKNIEKLKPEALTDKKIDIRLPSRNYFRAMQRNCFGHYLEGKIAGAEWYESKVRELNADIDQFN